MLLCIYAGVSSALQAQDCQCAIEKEFVERVEQHRANGDMNTAMEMANALVADEYVFCRFMGLDLLFQIFFEEERINEAAECLTRQNDLGNQISCNPSLLTHLYLNNARYQYQVSNYSASVQFCYKLIPLAEKNNDVESIISARQILVQILSFLDRDMESAQIARGSYQLIMNSPDSRRKADYLQWLVKNYDGFFTSTNDPAYLDTMSILSEEVRRVASSFNNTQALIENYWSTDYICYYRGSYQLGLNYLDSAFRLVNYSKDGQQIARLHLSKAWDYCELKNFPRAFFHHDSSLYYFRKYYSAYELSNGFTDGAEIYAQAGDFKTAYSYYQSGMAIRDSISSVVVSNTISELEQKYNKDINERIIEDLSQDKEISDQKEKVSSLKTRLLIGVIVVIVLLVVIGVFIYRQRLLKQRHEKLEVEQRLNRTRMNPHFFFNALTSLQDLSLDPNRVNELPQYLGKYAKIMRLTLENTYHEMISIEEEIEYVTKYMEIQQLRFPGKFEYNIVIDKNIDTFDLLMPAMILQPFVENSIEHGFSEINHKGIIEISLSLVGDQLQVTIVDNGSKSHKGSSHAGYPSRARQIIADRLRLLNERLHSKASFTVLEDTQDSGYKIVLLLPMIKPT